MNTATYESFNARNLTPEEVAETFIPNKDYEDLWHNEHTVVLGPRGSGKTTLFKMLTVQAIYSWNTPLALALRNSRIFTAIYVPTDMHWHHQLKHGERQFASSPALQETLSRCAVTTSILLAVIKTFQARAYYEGTSDLNVETFVAKHLISEWKLDKTIPTYEMITIALKGRINQIRAMVNSHSYRTDLFSISNNLPDFYYLDYFAAMDYACAVFDTGYKLKQSKKWALCLDEMELAPTWLQNLALSQVRSSDQGHLIKVSTSPIPSVSGNTGATPKHDYELISIWNYSGHESDAFSRQLAASVLKRKVGRHVALDDIFGVSDLAPGGEDKPERYEQGSPEWQLFKDAAQWDSGFRNLLDRHGISADNPVTDDIGLRDSVLRKAKPIVKFRSAFLKQSKKGPLWLRSRKLAGVYYGTNALFRISDGNPRRLISILNDLSVKLHITSSGRIKPLSANEQDEVLTSASAQFLGYVHALPGGSMVVDTHDLDLVTILKAIATYFRQNILSDEFTLDPKGSFVVDSNLNVQLVELLRLGVYHGAIVHVDPVPNTIETTVVGKRFRLSYMLSPGSKLPLTLYSEISLARILRSSARLRVRKALNAIEQRSLPIQEKLPL